MAGFAKGGRLSRISGWMRTAIGALSALGAAAAQAAAQPLIARTEQHEWTLNIDVRVRSAPARFTDGATVSRPIFKTRFRVDDAAVVFPLIGSSATSKVDLAGLRSALRFDNRLRDDEPDILDDYQAGERMGVWRLGEADGTELSLQLRLPVTTWSARFDESAALRAPWPDEADLPPVAISALAPQAFVESDDPHILDLVDRLTLGRARAVPPALLAKFLLGVVVERFQPDSAGQHFNERGGYAGMDVLGAAVAARRWTGSVFDMAALTCALYRAAGIPARVVIGYDVARTQGRLSGLVETDYPCGQASAAPVTGAPLIHAWVEFFLLTNPEQREGEWIPVDPWRQREFSSAPPPMEQSWAFFGSHPCANGLIPLSFHFFPPTDVITAGAPALWGWLSTPDIPVVDQEIRFDAFTTPVWGK